jgi:4-amino-4-deoxy-L-arabinose transferase-like glycosyltransferase
MEAYIYDRFVSPTTRQVLARELPNRDILYALLEKRSVGLFRVSPFSVRLPSLLSALLYFWSVWRLARRLARRDRGKLLDEVYGERGWEHEGTGWLFFLAVALAGLFSLWWGGFTQAQGGGTALALQVCATQLALSVTPQNINLNLNLAGACLGLSVAARLDFVIPAMALALAFLAIHRRWFLWTDRILIPAAVTALVFLVLPLSHAHAASEAPPDVAAQVNSAIQVLRASAGSQHVRIGASPGIAPVLNFYRAQYRLRTWDRAERNLASGSFDYYLLAKGDTGLIEQRHLIVLYRDPDFVLARRSYDAM